MLVGNGASVVDAHGKTLVVHLSQSGRSLRRQVPQVSQSLSPVGPRVAKCGKDGASESDLSELIGLGLAPVKRPTLSTQSILYLLSITITLLALAITMSDREQHSGTGSHADSPAHLNAPSPRIPNIPPRVASPSNSAFNLNNSNASAIADPSDANQRRQWRQHRYAGVEADDSDRPSSTAPIDDSEVPTPQNMADLDSVPISDEQKARIIDRHLNLPGASHDTSGAGTSSWSVAGGGPAASSVAFPRHDTRESHHPADDSAADASRFTLREQAPSPHDDDGNESEYFAPHHAQGGAIVEDIYRWAHQNRRKGARRTRSESAHLPRTSTIDPDLDVEQIREPGGFRRFFMLTQAARQGQPPPRAVRSFIDFLSLYGHFAGEDLNEYDDEDEDEEDEEAPRQAPTERTALLRRRSSRRRYNGSQDGDKPRGEASVTEATMMLLKSFVGTGILFLGKVSTRDDRYPRLYANSCTLRYACRPS